MNIGFDAKRLYENSTGLGHYSRTLITSLAKTFPENDYFLFAPKITDRFLSDIHQNIYPVAPTAFLSRILKSAWRSKWMIKDLRKKNIEIYHGLSHEIPFGINKTKIKSVVTIHDLIFERYPEQFSNIDVKIYRKKFMYACRYADKIIAISKQTKNDIVDLYKIPDEKIEVCYQSCNDIFRQIISDEEKMRVKQIYNLPDEFFLYVGSVIERKNLLTIVKAMHHLQGKVDIPLVVIGNGKKYKTEVKDFLKKNNLQNKVVFLSEKTDINSLPGFTSSADFPAIYQQAVAMIYPSVFEGFGIPVLEALCSGLPVITSNVSSLPEAGGDAAYYVNPHSPEEIAGAMQNIYSDKLFAEIMIEKGFAHAQNFTQKKTAGAVMGVYKKI